MHSIKGIKRWILLRAISVILVFCAIMIPLNASFYVLVYSIPVDAEITQEIRNNALSNSEILLTFSYFVVSIMLWSKLFVKLQNSLKSNEHNFKKNKIMLETILVFIIVLINVMYCLYVVFILNSFTIFTPLIGGLYLIVAYLYMYAIGTLSNQLENKANTKIEQFRKGQINE